MTDPLGGRTADVDTLLATPLPALMSRAASLRDEAHGNRVSYSRKVFIPLTHLCRDVCHYCTFAHPPKQGEAAFLSPDQVLSIARAGAAAGCKEALFTLGDKPELRYRAAREALDALGYATTIDYLIAMSRLVLGETGLLPHANPGVLTADEISRLRKVSVSQGIMLESASTRLMEKGGPHHGSPDKDPAIRLETIAEAGRQHVPFTSGILIGIGETRRERLEALVALKDLHDTHGHIQEIIVQNFRAKPGTRMVDAPEPDVDDLLWTIAAARVLFGGEMNIQAPPNLSPEDYPRLIGAGLNDWGGVSPVTPDHVNPEAPWPEIERLSKRTSAAGKSLTERLATYPAYLRDMDRWVDPALHAAVHRVSDADGYGRSDPWSPGTDLPLPNVVTGGAVDRRIDSLVAGAANGERLSESEVTWLLNARGGQVGQIARAADDLRRDAVGDTVTYAVNRNINYTNVCYFRCQFCAFSKGKMSENLRGAPYEVQLDEIVRRATEAWERGATEVCMQGGIHPDYTGDTYLSIARAVREALPSMHIHAFSPLEVSQGAKTLGIPVAEFLDRLVGAGLGTLPGTAAEILDDEIRQILCSDKLTTDEWLSVVETAHERGIRTTATVMFGHMERPIHQARHLLRLRDLQERTGGFTEFVPLPFVHMEAPIYLKGGARQGPTWRETLLIHAVARIVFHGLIPNIQASWVKLGAGGVTALLDAGVNDLGGTLMNESISRAAGTGHGQEMPPAAMEALIQAAGRVPRQRTTLYGTPPVEQMARSFDAAPLSETGSTPAQKFARITASA